jgi:hypothetical protein
MYFYLLLALSRGRDNLTSLVYGIERSVSSDLAFD